MAKKRKTIIRKALSLVAAREIAPEEVEVGVYNTALLQYSHEISRMVGIPAGHVILLITDFEKRKIEGDPELIVKGWVKEFSASLDEIIKEVNEIKAETKRNAVRDALISRGVIKK